MLIGASRSLDILIQISLVSSKFFHLDEEGTCMDKI